ncbi:MAG TPA: ABC transporter substrate-binding protein, partial [Ilumatobacter sp.]|nr:ABC transporter substrate-binding protein [Ilumatobacter sp.]
AESTAEAATAEDTGGGEETGGGEDARQLVIARDMDVNSLDPSRSYCDTCQIFNTAVYETLITVDPADPNTLEPRLATEWEASADSTQFTFTLDPAATFADGSPVEAADVKWSWERLANIQAPASYLMSGLESIEAPDASTVIVTFAAPNSAFLPIVAAPYMGIINTEVAEAQGASAGTDAATDTAEQWFLSNSAGSGPYQLESYTEGESLILSRNDNYWGPNKPVFPEVTFAQVKDASSQLQQLQQGDVDIAMQISFDSVSQLEGDSNVSVEIVDSFNFVYIALSPGAVGAENLQDVTVRNAIRSAIDYDGAIDALVAGNGKKQASPIPNGFLGSADLPLPEYDPEGAQAALEAAGLGDGFSLDATYPEANVYGVDFSLMMQKIQQDLDKVGVQLELTPVQFPEWAEKIDSQGIPVTAVYFAPDHTDSSQYVQFFGMIPDSSWSGRAGGGSQGEPIINQEEVDLLAEALASSGDAKAQSYTALGQMMIDDAVIIPIVNPQLILANASDLTGMHYSACCNLDLGRLGVSG